MHIVNIMFSQGLGGIEQAFLDYCKALSSRGHRVTAICAPGAAVEAALIDAGIETVALGNKGLYDIMASYRLGGVLKKLQPDAVIAHGMRAYGHARRATRRVCPLVGVTHNYSTKRLHNADAVFATTRPLHHKCVEEGVAPERVFDIPNMIDCPAVPPERAPWRQPPMIGSMGRFVAKKGFDIYIEALGLLKAAGYNFQAVLGGAGQEGAYLTQRIADLELGDVLTLAGWVEDKEKFFAGIDIFCLPSLHEPFGIVLLEAFAHKVPVVSSNSEGPQDIVIPNMDAVLVEKNDPPALATALGALLDDPHAALRMADHAFAKARSIYTMDAVALRMETALQKIITQYKA